MICWTLGITEHHNAVDNVARAHQPRSADRARRPLWLRAESVARPKQRPGGRRHGGTSRPPARLPARGGRWAAGQVRRRLWGQPIPPKRGWHLSGMFDAMERGELTALYVIGENPVAVGGGCHAGPAFAGRSGASGGAGHVSHGHGGTRACRVAGGGKLVRIEGTVTNSERRVQRVRKALNPPGQARDDMAIIYDLARRLGYDWGEPSAEAPGTNYGTSAPIMPA